MREDISMPAGFGIRIFLNRNGSVSLQQHQQYEEQPEFIVLSAAEARQTAHALLEVADSATALARKEAECKSTS